MGHALMENRNRLVVDNRVSLASGTAELKAPLDMIEQVPGRHRINVDADKGNDMTEFVNQCSWYDTTAHVA